jgi:hypothetical protein
MSNGTSIEYSKQFQFVGTIKKVATFASKGGGLMVELETGDKNIASEVVNAQGMACNFVVQVSAVRVGSGSVGEDQPELDGIGSEESEGEEEV